MNKIIQPWLYSGSWFFFFFKKNKVEILIKITQTWLYSRSWFFKRKTKLIKKLNFISQFNLQWLAKRLGGRDSNNYGNQKNWWSRERSSSQFFFQILNPKKWFSRWRFIYSPYALCFYHRLHSLIEIVYFCSIFVPSLFHDRSWSSSF